MPNKIIIVGTSGAGKSTLAYQLAQKLDLAHIELDSLFWNADWQPTPAAEFRERIVNAMNQATGGWVMDGNYSKIREAIWAQADTVIWLDYPLWLIYWRVVSRTIKRIVTRQELWHGNRETVWNSFFTKESIIWWAHTTYHRRRKQYNALIASGDYSHINFIIFSHPQETQHWLNSL